MESILSKNGYKIKKKSLTPKSLKELKDELNVKPFVYNDYNNTSSESKFQVYLESPNSIYIPKFYGIEKYGLPQKSKMNDGDDINSILLDFTNSGIRKKLFNSISPLCH